MWFPISVWWLRLRTAVYSVYLITYLFPMPCPIIICISTVSKYTTLILFYPSSPLLYIIFACSLYFIVTACALFTCSIVLFGLMTTRLNKYYYLSLTVSVGEPTSDVAVVGRCYVLGHTSSWRWNPLHCKTCPGCLWTPAVCRLYSLHQANYSSR